MIETWSRILTAGPLLDGSCANKDNFIKKWDIWEGGTGTQEVAIEWHDDSKESVSLHHRMPCPLVWQMTSLCPDGCHLARIHQQYRPSPSVTNTRALELPWESYLWSCYHSVFSVDGREVVWVLTSQWICLRCCNATRCIKLVTTRNGYLSHSCRAWVWVCYAVGSWDLGLILVSWYHIQHFSISLAKRYEFGKCEWGLIESGRNG